MTMSQGQREEQSFRMWCHWNEDIILKLSENPELMAKAEEMAKDYEEEGNHGKEKEINNRSPR